MSRRSGLPLALAFAFWTACRTSAAWAEPPAPAVHQAQVEARILSAPQAVRTSDGRRHLAYELRLTSDYSGETPLTLTRLAIFSDAASAALAVIDGAGLQALLPASAENGGAADGVAIRTGRSQTLFLWLALPDGAAPKSLRHQLTFRADKGAIQRADDVRTPVVAASPVEIGPPLRGGRWMAVEGPGDHRSHHWGGETAINGRLTIPQRFAIDWFGLDDGDHSVRGAHESLAATRDADWVGFGRDVLAAADGTVVDIRDDVPDGRPLAPQETPEDLTARTLYGNFVILRIAPGVYAHYAHLRAGGASVRVGQTVRRGAVLGQVGQTGSAGAPHLHFHLSDRPTFEQSEGLPFVIDAFTLLGQGTIEETFDPARPVALRASQASSHRAELPLDGSVVTFP